MSIYVWWFYLLFSSFFSIFSYLPVLKRYFYRYYWLFSTFTVWIEFFFFFLFSFLSPWQLVFAFDLRLSSLWIYIYRYKLNKRIEKNLILMVWLPNQNKNLIDSLVKFVGLKKQKIIGLGKLESLFFSVLKPYLDTYLTRVCSSLYTTYLGYQAEYIHIVCVCVYITKKKSLTLSRKAIYLFIIYYYLFFKSWSCHCYYVNQGGRIQEPMGKLFLKIISIQRCSWSPCGKLEYFSIFYSQKVFYYSIIKIIFFRNLNWIFNLI